MLSESNVVIVIVVIFLTLVIFIIIGLYNTQLPIYGNVIVNDDQSNVIVNDDQSNVILNDDLEHEINQRRNIDFIKYIASGYNNYVNNTRRMNRTPYEFETWFRGLSKLNPRKLTSEKYFDEWWVKWWNKNKDNYINEVDIPNDVISQGFKLSDGGKRRKFYAN